MDFTGLKVLVIGDTCLDIITNGESTRLSPEAPVPVIKNPTKHYSLGMAGNVALNLKKLGANVDLFTYVGEDIYGNIIQDLMFNYGLCDSFKKYELDINSKSIVKERVMANGHQIARLDIEDVYINPEFAIETFKDGFNDFYDFVIVSDYNKGLITKDTWHEFLDHILDINKGKIFVDTKKENILSYYEDTILFPNSKELEIIKNETFCDNMEDLLIELDTNLIIETASEKGAYAHTKNGSFHSPAKSSEVFDVCGAGDTFIAAFSLYYTKFANIQRSLDFANHCCSKVIRKRGTTPIEYTEALEFEYKGDN